MEVKIQFCVSYSQFFLAFFLLIQIRLYIFLAFHQLNVSTYKILRFERQMYEEKIRNEVLSGCQKPKSRNRLFLRRKNNFIEKAQRNVINLVQVLILKCACGFINCTRAEDQNGLLFSLCGLVVMCFPISSCLGQKISSKFVDFLAPLPLFYATVRNFVFSCDVAKDLLLH